MSDITVREAKEMVVDWLRAGGQPTEMVPLTYAFFFPSACSCDGHILACAGAAIVYLVHGSEEGDKNTLLRPFSSKHFGDDEAFFRSISEKMDPDNTEQVADYVEGLCVIS